MRTSILPVLLLLLVTVPAPSARALTVSFDGLTPGTVVTTVDGVTFTLNVPSLDRVVSTGLPTVSPANYLGASGSLDDVFLPGDVLGLTLPFPAQTLTLSVISTAGTPAGAFALVTSEGSVSSGATPDQMLGDDEVYLLSFTSSTPFQTAELQTVEGDLFAFHVDEIVVPEPGGPVMFGIGALAIGWARRRRRGLDRPPTGP